MQLSEVKGQAHALHSLERAIVNRHLAHAYLFSGPEGVGKRMAALALAQYLNCRAPDTAQLRSCEVCPSCRQAVLGAHPDVIVVQPDGAHIKIEQIRSLLGKAALHSYESAYKVILLDDAHRMTEEAANCLLKTLEEPVRGTLFILISSQPQNLPATIVSRCQEVQFQALPTDLVRQILERLHPERQSRIELAAALSRGSVRTAEQLLADEEVIASRQALYELLAQIADAGPAQILLLCARWDKNRPMIHTLLEMAQLWYHDILLLRTGGDTALLANQDQTEQLAGQRIGAETLLTVQRYFQDALAQLESNVTPRLVLEVALLKTRAAILGERQRSMEPDGK